MHGDGCGPKWLLMLEIEAVKNATTVQSDHQAIVALKRGTAVGGERWKSKPRER